MTFGKAEGSWCNSLVAATYSVTLCFEIEALVLENKEIRGEILLSFWFCKAEIKKHERKGRLTKNWFKKWERFRNFAS